MENEQSVIFIKVLIWIVVAFLIGLNLYHFLKFIGYYFYKRPLFVYVPFMLKKMGKPKKQIIANNFPIYKKMSASKRAIFDHRVIKFEEYHEFIAREGFVITDEVKLLVSSCAVLLTFGMRFFDLPSVDKILIFPDVYFSTVNNAYHKGEFNPKHKTVVFSWKHFLEGLDNQLDGINLGFHEFAHALFFATLTGQDTSSEVFQEGMEDLRAIFLDEERLEVIEKSGFLRTYAFTDYMEFFSVCVETLVENPKQFKATLPELYDVIVRMLNFTFIEKKSF